MGGQLREINCPCGHSYESDRKVNWCPKCGQKIFKSEKERRAHQVNRFYIFAVVGLSMSALAYFFFKLIIIPAIAM